jgi:hypothetical protein
VTPVVSGAGIGGVIGKEHEAEMVDVESMVGMSKEDEAMVSVIGTTGMANWQGRAFGGVAATAGAERWEV